MIDKNGFEIDIGHVLLSKYLDERIDKIVKRYCVVLSEEQVMGLDNHHWKPFLEDIIGRRFNRDDFLNRDDFPKWTVQIVSKIIGEITL